MGAIESSEVGFTSLRKNTQFAIHSLWLLADEQCEAISLLQRSLLLPYHCLLGPRLRVLIILNTASVTANGANVWLDLVTTGCGVMEERLLCTKGGRSLDQRLRSVVSLSNQ